MIHILSRVIFPPEVENVEGYGAQQFLLIPQYYAGLKMVFLSFPTIPNMMWFAKNIAYKSELRGSISIRDSPPFPVLTMLAPKRNVHHFLLIKAEKKARFVRDDPASKTRVDICKRTKTCAAQEF